jgi:hypothetical protein
MAGADEIIIAHAGAEVTDTGLFANVVATDVGELLISPGPKGSGRSAGASVGYNNRR